MLLFGGRLSQLFFMILRKQLNMRTNMKDDVPVQNGIAIPANEIEITSSRSGGAGGQHINKTDTRITVRWNIPNTRVLDEVQKIRALQNLQSSLTGNGDLVIHSSSSRSQQQNKEDALIRLAKTIRNALHVPKKRMATRISKATKALRLDSKKHRGTIKKMRFKRFSDD
jgi:ribosome-associated protein